MKIVYALQLALVVCLFNTTTLAQYTKLLDFSSSETGCYPHYGALVSDGTYLYGTTSNCGQEGNGVVYRIKKDGTDFMILHDFNDDEGYVLEGTLLLLDGYVYGTTRLGGANGAGIIFKMLTDGNDFSILASFDNAVQGSNPYSGLIELNGVLYGAASGGGANNKGSIYKINPDGSGFELVFSFNNDGYTGVGPRSDLITDGTYLYGQTVSGGSISQGTAYRIKPDGTEYLTINDYIDDPNGSSGYGVLVYDGTEYLYGMTNTGGEYNRGTIFKVKTDGTGYVKLRDFNNDDGAQPLGGLVLQGTTLYGMTELAGSDANGNVYSIETDGTNFQTLVDFSGDNGSLPFGTLLLEDNVLYGFTTEGGANNTGVIFKYGLSGSSVASKSEEESFQVYPNPANDFMTIDRSSDQTPAKIEIVDARGATVVRETMTGRLSAISLHTLSAGLYVIKLSSTKGTYTEHLVVE